MKQATVPSHLDITQIGMLPEKHCQNATKIGMTCPSQVQTVVQISPLWKYQIQTGKLLKPLCQTVNRVIKVHQQGIQTVNLRMHRQDIQTVANLAREPARYLQPIIPAVVLMNKMNFNALHLQANVSQGENSIFFWFWNWNFYAGEFLHKPPRPEEFSIKRLTEQHKKQDLMHSLAQDSGEVLVLSQSLD